MKLTEKDKQKLKALAVSTKCTFLVEYLEKVKDEVVDVRFTINAKAEYDRDVRLAVCKVIDELLISKLAGLAKDQEKNTDDWS